MLTGASVLLTPTRKAYAKLYFNEHWREDCDRLDAINAANANGAAFPKTADLNLDDNRGTAATLLCEAGATPQEVAEAMCWTIDKAQKMFETYMARRSVLANNVIQKLEDYRDRKPSG